MWIVPLSLVKISGFPRRLPSWPTLRVNFLLFPKPHVGKVCSGCSSASAWCTRKLCSNFPVRLILIGVAGLTAVIIVVVIVVVCCLKPTFICLIRFCFISYAFAINLFSILTRSHLCAYQMHYTQIHIYKYVCCFVTVSQQTEDSLWKIKKKLEN